MDSQRCTWEYVCGRLIDETRSQKFMDNVDIKATIAVTSTSGNRRGDFQGVKDINMASLATFSNISQVKTFVQKRSAMYVQHRLAQAWNVPVHN